MKIITKHYTPHEAEVATGRTVENCRNDRRAGYDPKVPGHARYGVVELARLYMRQEFANCGVKPQKSQAFLDDAAANVAGFLARMPAAWSRPFLSSYFRELRDRKPTELNIAGTKIVLPSFSGILGEGIVPGPLVEAIDPQVPACGYFSAGLVIWPGGKVETFKNAWGVFGDLTPGDPRAIGPAVVMTYFPMARGLAARLPRPLFFPETEA